MPHVSDFGQAVLEPEIRQIDFDRLESIESGFAALVARLKAAAPACGSPGEIVRQTLASLSERQIGKMISAIGRAAHKHRSEELANTIHYHGPKEDLESIWLDFSYWLVTSLRAGKKQAFEKPKRRNRAAERADADPETEASDWASDDGRPIEWNPEYRLLGLVWEHGLGFLQGKFVSHGFNYSKVSMLLRLAGLAQLVSASAFHVDCPKCEHSHTFLMGVPCGAICCAEAPFTVVKRTWLLSCEVKELLEAPGPEPDSDDSSVRGSVFDAYARICRKWCEVGSQTSFWALLILAEMTGELPSAARPPHGLSDSAWPTLTLTLAAKQVPGRAQRVDTINSIKERVLLNLQASHFFHGIETPLPALSAENYSKIMSLTVKQEFLQEVKRDLGGEP